MASVPRSRTSGNRKWRPAKSGGRCPRTERFLTHGGNLTRFEENDVHRVQEFLGNKDVCTAMFHTKPRRLTVLAFWSLFLVSLFKNAAACGEPQWPDRSGGGASAGLESLRTAVESLQASFPSQYPGEAFLRRLADLRKPQAGRATVMHRLSRRSAAVAVEPPRGGVGPAAAALAAPSPAGLFSRVARQQADPGASQRALWGEASQGGVRQTCDLGRPESSLLRLVLRQTQYQVQGPAGFPADAHAGVGLRHGFGKSALRRRIKSFADGVFRRDR